MNKIIPITLLYLLLYSTNSFGDINQYPNAAFMLTNTTLGKEFWVAIPKNEAFDGTLREIGIEIVVTSFKTCYVRMEIPGIGVDVTKKVEAFKLTTFSSKKNEVPFSMEIMESQSEMVTQKGIRLSSDVPFSVHVVNAKQYSGESYLAIPVNAWGTDYFHCAYYDWYSTQSAFEDRKDRAGGFIVVSSEDGTKVTIKLNGVGAAESTTMAGHEIGDTWSVTLNRGETYMVQGIGKTLGKFDISGSRITSTKPIGLISYHMRTMVPSLCPEDRDNLCEMLPPTHQWGKQFATVQFDRKPSGNTTGKGDLFRVVAMEDNTKITLDFYDIKTGSLLGHRERPNIKSGEFVEIDDIKQIVQNNKATSIYGVAIWTATKPVLLVQYAFSNSWDSDLKWAPLNVVVPPVEQFVKRAIFQTPEDLNFNENELTLVAIGDPNDAQATLLKSIKLDGQELYKSDGSILVNRVPGTNLYWARIFMNTVAAHWLEADTKFYGYVNGFAPYNAYGAPAAMGTHKIDEYDEVPPKFIVSENCGNFTVEATEKVNGNPVPSQKDQGLQNIVFIEEASTNFSFEMDVTVPFKPQNKITSKKFYLKPIDRLKSGKAVFGAVDRAGNYTIDSVSFVPDSIEFVNTSLLFGNTRLYTTKIMEFEIKNTGSKVQQIKSLSFKKGTNFSLVVPADANGFNIEPKQSKVVGIKFTPGNESVNESDTLIVTDICSSLKFYLSGVGVAPHVEVSDFDFGSIETRKEKCTGIDISNIGTDTVTVTAIEGIVPPFFIKNQDPPFPFVIAPGTKINLSSICFFPQDSGTYSAECILISDAIGNDTIMKLTGHAFKKDSSTDIIDFNSYNKLISITPNPAISQLNIKLSNNLSTDAKLEIYNISGELVSKYCFQRDSYSTYNSIDISNLHSGVYYIRFISGAGFDIVRFVVLK